MTETRDEMRILIISASNLPGCHFCPVLGMITFNALARVDSAVGFKFKSEKLASKPERLLYVLQM